MKELRSYENNTVYKTFEGKVFTIREGNGYSWKNLQGNMLTYGYCQSIWPWIDGNIHGRVNNHKSFPPRKFCCIRYNLENSSSGLKKEWSSSWPVPALLLPAPCLAGKIVHENNKFYRLPALAASKSHS